jgi:CDP-glucose 4,6-dehydratase
LFEVAQVQGALAQHTLADIGDAGALKAAMQAAQTEIVFHLAAQPLVRSSYHDPVATFSTNVMGTVNLLEAVRACPSVRSVVNVTTDKCYANQEWVWGYRECEALGGHDPYSASKACAEIATAAYRSAFFAATTTAVATARAGNVIGGGDWALDRIVPDFFRAFDADHVLEVRYPGATRPWQHVLEPLCGYITLAEQLYTQGQSLAQAWNFGPADTDAQPVRWLLEQLTAQMPGARWSATPGDHPHEAGYLKRDSSKAQRQLSWAPRWSLIQALAHTVDWHRAWARGADMHAFSLHQIQSYLPT